MAAYSRAIQRAADEAGVPRWSPNMLRHAFATRVKKELGRDASRAALGHAVGSDITEDYFDKDLEAATEVALKMG